MLRLLMLPVVGGSLPIELLENISAYIPVDDDKFRSVVYQLRQAVNIFDVDHLRPVQERAGLASV